MNEREALREQLYGVNSHLHTLRTLEGMSALQAGQKVSGAAHTIFQILHHMVYWQDLAVARLRRENPSRPASAALGWRAPPAPEDDSDWEAAVACLAEGLRDLEAVVADPSRSLDDVLVPDTGQTAREEVLMVQGHNSYHLGQIVMLRQQLGCWPPPQGGDTW